MDGCKVPETALLPKTGGIKSPLSCLNQARYGIAWGAVGAAMACYETALDYAKDRVQFSRPIAGYQLVQRKLVEMLTEITKAQLLCWRLGRLKEEGKHKHTQVSLAKRNNVHHALEIARMARDILGANGIMYEYPVARHMLNLESVFTYEGTHDIHTLILGQDITGISAFE
jgi:glutaryl-CoA dehydrogenase